MSIGIMHNYALIAKEMKLPDNNIEKMCEVCQRSDFQMEKRCQLALKHSIRFRNFAGKTRSYFHEIK